MRISSFSLLTSIVSESLETVSISSVKIESILSGDASISSSNSDFAKIKVNTAKNYSGSEINNYIISREDNKLYIVFGSDVNNPDNTTYMKGNALTLRYYYNNQN